MKKIIKYLVIVFIVSIFFTGCKKNKDNPIVGIWELYQDNQVNGDVYYIFNSNNTGTYTIFDNTKQLTYEIKDKYIVITYQGDSKSNEIEYSIQDDILTIIDGFGEKITYKKR
jgi:hypothetical protein